MEVVGSKTPIVILSYRNCEIYCCHLDGYGTNTKELLLRLTEIEEIFLAKPSHLKYRVWYNIDENSLQKETIRLIEESIFRVRFHIHKLALIGISGFTKLKFNYILTRTFEGTTLCKEYFTDAEIAKGWLVYVMPFLNAVCKKFLIGLVWQLQFYC